MTQVRAAAETVPTRDGTVLVSKENIPSVPPSPLHMNELQVQEHTKLTADKWKFVAEHGASKNEHWEEVRAISATKLRQMPFAQGEQGTLLAAQREMQGMMERANAMGFRPDQNESAGAYLERVAREMSEPLTDKQLVDRATTMWNAMGKFITFRGNLHPAPSAAHFISDRVLPGADSTPAGKEFMQVQNVLRRIHANTGIEPAVGEDARSYAERAIRVQLKKTPTLHADMLLEAKKVVPPTPVPMSNQPGSAVKTPPRWDKEA